MEHLWHTLIFLHLEACKLLLENYRVSYPGYPTGGKICHPARLLSQPTIGDPKALTACQPLKVRTTNSISPEPCGEASGTIGISGDISPSRPSPRGVIKGARPPAVCFHLARGARGALRQDGEPRGPPNYGTRSIDVDVTVHSQQGHMNVNLTRHDPFSHDDIHSSTATGVMAAVPPNPLTTKIPAHTSTTFMTQRRTGQGMAPAHHTSERRGQKINVPHDSTLQGNYSHRIRRRMAMPEATFLAFLFHFSCFHHFTANVTRALPLEAIKGKVGAASRGDETTRQQ
jgi:hypothetical protein